MLTLARMSASGNNPPLGGPGHLDPASIIGIFTIAFSMTVAFSTLVLMRAREAFVANGKTKEAVMTALRETAAATTGAGIVMVAALIPFITTDFLQVRAFGIGVAIAILLDVLIVRPLLIPAAAAVLGKVGWWPTRAPVQTPPATPSPQSVRRPHRFRLHRARAAH